MMIDGDSRQLNSAEGATMQAPMDLALPSTIGWFQIDGLHRSSGLQLLKTPPGLTMVRRCTFDLAVDFGRPYRVLVRART